MDYRFTELVLESSLAASILANEDGTDVELIPVRPDTPDNVEKLAELWEPRELRWVGVIGLVNGMPRTVLQEPLTECQTEKVRQAFSAYCTTAVPPAVYGLDRLTGAECPAYVIANPDGSDAEFVPLKLDAATAESAWRDLRARWAGRNLKGVGVAGLIHGIPTLMLREEPEDFLLVVRLTAAFARYVEDTAANDSQEPQPHPDCIGDSVAWCERLYALPDTRSEA